MTNLIDSYLATLAATLGAVDRAPVVRAVQHLYTRWQLGALFLTCGNGGSAATAQHLACDLTKATRYEGRKPVRAVCLNDNIAGLTAWANDADYDVALMEQLRSVGQSGDVLIAISGSGNSRNVLRAATYARQHQITVVAMTGMAGKLGDMADIMIRVPAPDLPTIEDAHLAICHALTNDLAMWVRE